MDFFRSLVRRPFAFVCRLFVAAQAAEHQKLKESIRKLRAEIRQKNQREKADEAHIQQLVNEARGQSNTIDSLHECILELEGEKDALEVEVEKLENTKVINELDITALTEKVQKHIEINRMERISAQLESNFLAQQGKQHGIDQPEQHRRERPAPTSVEAR